MGKRYQKTAEPSSPGFREGLPTDRPIAVYYRQSSAGQVGNVSTSIQKEDLPRLAQRHGWTENLIMIIDDDEGISASKVDMDERPGSKKLMGLIERREIGAVMVVKEDRLSRDSTMIDPNKFIKACRKAGVLVITPSITYDFNGPMRKDYIMIFRQRAQEAAEYIETHIGYMAQARLTKRKNGLHAGGNITPGYVVNPDEKYEGWEPYATPVREYFRLYVEHYHGDLSATARHIRTRGPFYPDFEDAAVRASVPKGRIFRKPYTLARAPNGEYYPKRRSLREMFTNVTYIGAWIGSGQVIRWNNHEAIVSEDLFWKAFNYLSPVTVNGDPNPDYHPRPGPRHRAGKGKPENQPRPLTDRMVYWIPPSGIPRVVTICWTTNAYYYRAVDTEPDVTPVWQKRADYVDNAIIAALTQRLKLSASAYMLPYLDGDLALAAANILYPDIEKKREEVNEDIAETEREMKRIERKIDLLEDPDLIRKQDEKYRACKARRERDEAKLADLDNAEKRNAALRELSADLYNSLEQIDTLSDQKKRDLLLLTINKIIITSEDNGDLTVDIYWYDRPKQTLTLPRSRENGWRSDEHARLLTLVDALKATPLEIFKAFPKRTHNSIRKKYYKLTGKWIGLGGYGVRREESYEDYLKRTDQTDSDLSGMFSGGHARYVDSGTPFNLVALWLAQPAKFAV